MNIATRMFPDNMYIHAGICKCNVIPRCITPLPWTIKIIIYLPIFHHRTTVQIKMHNTRTKACRWEASVIADKHQGNKVRKCAE